MYVNVCIIISIIIIMYLQLYICLQCHFITFPMQLESDIKLELCNITYNLQTHDCENL